MLTFDKFDGINNVLPSARLSRRELAEAINVDLGLSGELRRRQGFSRVDATAHRNLWQGPDYLLATVSGDLVAIAPDGVRTMLHVGLGDTRVWYCNLPDGRVAFSNGVANGLTDGATVTAWGVPLPAGVGSALAVDGQLIPGEYRYALTYVRLADGLEGGPVYSDPVQLPGGGLVLTGLPVLAGYRINVYLSSHHGGAVYLAGNSTTGAFSFSGRNDALVLPLRSDFEPAPLGTLCSAWRGRALVAVGGVLYASRAHHPEAFDLRRDFKQFGAPITLIQPVDDGLYVGTTQELAFLGGTAFDQLAYQRVVAAPVVLGSGVEVPGEQIRLGDTVGHGRAMICIADHILLAGLSSGTVVRLTQGRYRTEATEVAATFRLVGGIPQYLAIPR